VDQRILDTLMEWGGDYGAKTNAEKLFTSWEHFSEFCKATVPAQLHAELDTFGRFKVGATEYDIPEVMRLAVKVFDATPENAVEVANFMRLMRYNGGENDALPVFPKHANLDSFLALPPGYGAAALPQTLGHWSEDIASDIFDALYQYAAAGVPAEYVRGLQLDDSAVYRKHDRGLHLFNAGVPAEYGHKLMMWEPESIAHFSSYDMTVEYADTYGYPLSQNLPENEFADAIIQLHASRVEASYGDYGMRQGVPVSSIIQAWDSGLPTEYLNVFVDSMVG
jgi:hypothetical protein